LKQLYNARDLGGFPVRGGGITRYGRFIRSELPDTLTDSDKAFLKDYGVTLSLDFRATRELELSPSGLIDESWTHYSHRPLWSLEVAHGIPESSEQKAKDAKVPRSVEDTRRLGGIDWVAVYTIMAEDNKAWVRENFEAIADEPGCVHFHCMTGKDRTGIFAAMLLGAAGVPDNDIIADYSVSQIYLLPFYMTYRENDAAFTGDPDLSLAFYRTHPETMQGFLKHIYGKYGDMRGYLTSCGISDEVLEKVIGSFVES
jgi:protein-tyrosine phosphatase